MSLKIGILFLVLALMPAAGLYGEQNKAERVLSLTVGKTYNYLIFSEEKPFGKHSFTVKNYEKKKGIGIYTIKTSSQRGSMHAEGEWVLLQDGTPQSFQMQSQTPGLLYSIRGQAANNKLTAVPSKNNREQQELTIPIDDKLYLIEHDNMLFFTVALAAVPRIKGITVTFKCFQPSNAQTTLMQITVNGKERIKYYGVEKDTWYLTATVAGEKCEMWMTEGGRILQYKENDGKVVAQLEVSEEIMPLFFMVIGLLLLLTFFIIIISKTAKGRTAVQYSVTDEVEDY
jgi:hypothetical protein